MAAMDPSQRASAPRTERILPGIWRLRLPLPWPGVPHGNAWALSAGDGIVLFDTGMGGKGRLRQLDLALAQAGFGVEDIRLLVCTHSHTDHYGLAAPIVEAAGCELWMHPAWEHVRLLADDPAVALERRLEVARQSGVPAAALERYRESRSGDEETGIDAIRVPDRDLLPGSRWRPTRASGRSTRPPATLPRTSSCTSPRAG
jgi:glyoxylase-like metal-dependent hydrolase (beta-lactamase superfamily II)